MSPQSISDLSKNLLRIRKLHGLTQMEAGNQIGISRTSYNQIEKARLVPTGKSMKAINNWLDKQSVLDNTSENIPIITLEMLENKIHMLSQEQRRKLILEMDKDIAKSKRKKQTAKKGQVGL